MDFINEKVAWALLRIAMGWIFFWAFIDKLFGLGFHTCVSKDGKFVGMMCDMASSGGNAAWLSGGNPTFGFLKFGLNPSSPVLNLYHAMAGHPIANWLFMLGLLGIGIALMLGIAVRLASVSGIVMMILMYLGVMLPANNPFLDEHLVYALIFLAFAFSTVGETWGMGKWWNENVAVKCKLLK